MEFEVSKKFPLFQVFLSLPLAFGLRQELSTVMGISSMLCHNLTPKSCASRPEGPCPQLALIGNKELLYSQWLIRYKEAGEGKGLRGKER